MSESEERSKIYAFQCCFCFEKFEICSNLEYRLLSHYYDLHAEDKRELELFTVEEEGDDGDNVITDEFLIEEGEETETDENEMGLYKIVEGQSNEEVEVAEILSTTEQESSLVNDNHIIKSESNLIEFEPVITESNWVESEIAQEYEVAEVEYLDEALYTDEAAVNSNVQMRQNTEDDNYINHGMNKLRKTYQCPLCAKFCTSSSRLKEHESYHYAPEYNCEICEKKFYRARSLRYHMNSHLGIEMPKFKSPKSTNTESSYYYGDQNSGDPLMPWKCLSCEKTSKTRRAIKDHYDRHHRTDMKKDCICHICGKTLCNRTALQDHLKIHTGLKEFECDLCGLKFPHKNTVRVHMIRHRTENMYKCKLCPATFKAWKSLDYHTKKHTGETNYSCEYCGKKFILSIHLKYHLSVHTGERHFHCYPCGKSYTRSNNLKKHNKSVHGIAMTKIPLNGVKPKQEIEENEIKMEIFE